MALTLCALYYFLMSHVFSVLMIIAMVAVLISLIAGIAGMAKGGDFNKKYGNKLMRIRIGLQGLALLLFALAVATK